MNLEPQVEGETEFYRVYGPPGTGKTTFLGKQARKWAGEYGSDSILIASFTRAAAIEIAGRNLPLDKKQIGTLHAHAYRALGHPQIVQRGHYSHWNEEHPEFRLDRFASGDRVEDAGAGYAFVVEGATSGDEVMAQIEMLRARRTPEELWPIEAAEMHKTWSEWKRGNDLWDFSDLIEVAIDNDVPPPSDADIMICDEAQDFTRLEMDLVRLWSKRMTKVMLAGDDDQAIYGFRGGDHRAMLALGDGAGHQKILPQSYRVPVAVHRSANQWIHQVSDRVEKDYFPTQRVGNVTHDPGGDFENVISIVKTIEEQLAQPDPDDFVADEDKKDPKVMVLASCAYMLGPLIGFLKEVGIPWYNPYRLEDNRWNPFKRGDSKKISSLDRVLAFLRPHHQVWGDLARQWTYGDLQKWIKDIDGTGIMLRGAKARIGRFPEMETCNWSMEMDELFNPMWDADEWDRLRGADITWFAEHILDSRRAKYALPLRVAQNDLRLLTRQPEVCVGTIHSVKGAQARFVHILPDISDQGMRSWMDVDTRDETVRLFYVAMTRAWESVTVWQPASWRHIPGADLVGGSES